MAKTKQEQIKADLIDQLERSGTAGKYYMDLVNDYMALWETKMLLINDIETRGVVIEYVTQAGTRNMKRNDSVGDLVKVNDRMVKLLVSLGIQPGQGGDVDDEM